MRLLDVDSLDLDHDIGDPQMKEFFGYIPPYAILSHTWGDEEVLFSDIINRTARQSRAFPKLLNTVAQAKKRSLRWVWIDTCCIDKSNTAELQESINSMYNWYQRSSVCFAYLEDVEATKSAYHDIDGNLRTHHRAGWEHEFCASRWFTRGMSRIHSPFSINLSHSSPSNRVDFTRTARARGSTVLFEAMGEDLFG